MGSRGTVIPTTWVLKLKGNDLKARIVAQGFCQHGLDLGTKRASTPALSTAKVFSLTNSQSQLGAQIR